MTVWVDPTTGLKRFATRAGAAAVRMDATGYGVEADEARTTLPPLPAGAVFDDEARARYREFSDVRRGAADFMALDGQFAHYLTDVYSAPPVPREALTDDCEIVVVGAGFAGLLLWHRLRDAGFTDVRVCEKAGDVGGTWYWNRYPGVACDVEAYSYLPLLDETGYIPSMKFASGFEIFEYCQMLAERSGFYDLCLFHTSVEGLTWDEAACRWTVRTDRGDEMRARFVVLANGILTTPQLARIDGIETFAGESFHTSRWRYDIDLTGKRVGIIGTGATAVQVIPEIAKVAGQLFVFQRTPSTIDVRDQRATTAEEVEAWAREPGWARARRQRFARIAAGRTAMQANDDYLSGKVDSYKEVKQHERALSIDEMVEAQLRTNFRIMEQIRARVDDLVHDPITAAALKPYYPYGCKRPTFHDQFLPTFNLPHVHLVDTAPLGVQRIDERGVVHDGTSYPLDVLIFATGFRWMAAATFDMVVGGDGRSLRQKWDDGGTRTFLGVHSHGFPNLFVVTGPQGGGGSFNFTDSIEQHTDYVTWMLQLLRERRIDRIDVTEQAEAAYADHCRDVDLATAPLRNCLTYYNGYGGAPAGSLAYYGGNLWHRWRVRAQESLEPYVLGAPVN